MLEINTIYVKGDKYMDKIYDEYFDKIYKWSIKKTNNREDAEDLTNSIFLAIFEYFNKNIDIEKLDNLIWKIAYNIWCTKAKKYIKDKSLVTYDESFEYGYDDITIDKLIYREIINEIDNMDLKNIEIQIFKMYYINDLSIKEISGELNITESNIKYYLFSTRKKIKERYNEK